MRHPLFGVRRATPVLASIVIAVGAASPALGVCSAPVSTCGGTMSPCRCGDLVVSDTKLTASHPVLRTACPDDGLFVASGVTLEISGTIRSARPASSGSVCAGIVVLDGATNVVVTTGKIVRFDIGVESEDFAGNSGSSGVVTNSEFSRLQILSSDPGGILDTGLQVRGNGNVITENILKGRIDVAGIRVAGSRNTVRHNHTKVLGTGIQVDECRDPSTGAPCAPANDFIDNEVSNNVTEGAVMSSPGVWIRGGRSATVRGNQATANNMGGFIIEGVDHTVTNNVARRNSDSPGYAIGGSGHTVTHNLAADTDFGGGFLVNGTGHTVANNVALRNEENGFTVAATTSRFERNRADFNGGFGVDDAAGNGTTNTYTGNVCNGNAPDTNVTGPPPAC
jgi:hypothetical protein